MARRLKHTRSIVRAEVLESRRLMCALHESVYFADPTPQEIAEAEASEAAGPLGASDPADIIWTNRGTATAAGAGDTDNFGATFGTLAPTARAVVDAVIVAYERMIVSFNYASAGLTYSLSLSMNASQGSGHGASAGLTSASPNNSSGKPKSGSITMGTGSNDGNPNGDNGWFLDPTPFDSSEFLGTIKNAFSGDAPSGSPAFNKGDFYTVVAAEMTHCMGLFGNSLTSWSSKTTNTGIPDTIGPGSLYVFQGPSIKHLLTSDNAGVQDFGSAVHSSEPSNSIVFGGETYIGAEDQGNAFYEFSRRYMINNTFSLMFKDAYAYSSIDPAKFGTMYSNLNETTGLVTVRGGAGTSADTITITNTGSKVTVSVDVGTDVAGTGLPGLGNLPAFVTEYDVSQISSISITVGDGNDIININSIDNATPITLVGDNGNDTINIGAGVYQNVLSNLTINGGGGTDAVVIDDLLDTGNDTYNYAGTSFSKTGAATTNLATVEGVTLKANGFDNIINVTGVTSGAPLIVQGGNGNDTFNVGSTNISGILALLTLDGGGQTDALNILDSGFAGATTYTVNSSNIARSTNAVSINYTTTESVAISGSSVGSAYNVTNTAINTPVLITAGAGFDNLIVNETATGGDVTIAPSTGLDQVSVNADATGQAIAKFTGTTALGSLSVGTGGLVSLQIAGKQAISSKILSLTGTGQLDLNDDGFILDYTGSSPLASVEPAILSGYAAGAWNGAGISSSLAASTPDRSVGYGEALPLGYTGNNYMGLVPDGTALLFRYTVLADASLDGTVGSTDFNAFVGGYGLSSAAPQPMWSQGNFDFNQKVNTIDFNYLAGQFGIVLPGPLLSAPSGVPSPAIFSNQPLNDDSEIDLLA